MIYLLAGTCLLMAYTGCASTKSRTATGAVINDSLRFNSVAERTRTEKRALAGDEMATLRLGEYCFLVEEDLNRAKYWYRIGASHGSQTAKENLASLERIDPNEWQAAHAKPQKKLKH